MLEKILQEQRGLIYDALKDDKAFIFDNKHSSFKMTLDKIIDKWFLSLNKILETNNTLTIYYPIYKKYKYKRFILNHEAISDCEIFFVQENILFNRYYWQQALDKLNHTNKEVLLNEENIYENYDEIISNLFLKNWEDALYKKFIDKNINFINRERNKLLSKMVEIIELSIKIEHLGLGQFDWDLSEGFWHNNGDNEILKWAEYFKTDPQAKRIIELLGRLKENAENSDNWEFGQIMKVDKTAKEEVIGLQLGKHIESVLPSELALIGDPTLSTLFDLKYLENKLVCFEYQGMSLMIDKKQKPRAKGPMILCIDTSGSMLGTPENVAKAVALYLASMAIKQKRKCFIINFSTKIKTIELTENQNIDRLISFLKMSFHGGTDVSEAFEYAIKLLNTDYKEADVLVISDFIMDSLPQNLIQDMTLLRQNGNRFNALILDEYNIKNDSLNTYFDKEWVFNFKTNNIEENSRK